jgi:hypothetical protein
MKALGRATLAIWLGLGMAFSGGCAAPGGAEDEDVVDGEFSPPFTQVEEGKEDSAGYTSIAAEQNYYSTQVWEIKNQWEDRTTTEAKKAGIAWGESSGLNWDEKYSTWVRGMRRIRSVAGWYDTFEITAPYGKTIPAPLLECAEVAIFLRATFASWYGLPFFMEAVDSAGRRIFIGHFGFRTAAGRYGTSALYKTAYKDYAGRNLAVYGWPQDTALRAKKLDGNGDDVQPFISETAHFGAFADELFLNKRVGHFMVLLLSYFGSASLATGVNAYNLKPAALREGDFLLERWQRSGVGHTLPLKNVERLDGGRLAVDLASGSMPRRQPKWEESAISKSYFTSEYTGGPGQTEDGTPYAKLGGGLKRWRVTKKVNGYWQNGIMSADVPSWINSTNYAAIAARPLELESLLGEPDPEALRDALLRGIEDKRTHLSRYPASCSARESRETFFRELYTVMQNHYGVSRTEVDRRYRQLEDYVYPELEYTKSKTCCWNSTNAEMATIIMDYARSQVNPAACQEPPVFKAQNGGYAAFKSYAVATGRGAQWKDWTEDEPCPQRGVVEDTEKPHDAAPYCSIQGGGSGCAEDQFPGNHSRSSARAVGAGTYDSLRVCSGIDDWFKFTVPSGRTLTVIVRFTHSSGDLDIRLQNAAGTQVAQSEGSTDSETVNASAAGDYFLRVFGYNGAANTYRLEVALQ